jgi:hypothetical protein
MQVHITQKEVKMAKEIKILIKVLDDGRMGTKIEQNFVDTIESIHTFVGILENLKAQQLEKLKTFGKVIKR